MEDVHAIRLKIPNTRCLTYAFPSRFGSKEIVEQMVNLRLNGNEAVKGFTSFVVLH